MQIQTISDLRKATTQAHELCGNHQPVFVEITGSLICFDCAKVHRREILESLAHTQIYDGWHISELTHSGEFDDEFCEVCNKHFGASVE